MNRKERRTKRKQINVLDEVMSLIKQHFPELLNKFDGLTDKRHQSYVVYEMRVIFVVRLLGLLCAIKSMNGLTRELNTEEVIENVGKICGFKLEEIPHHDTINDVLENIDVKELEKINIYMVKRLIRSKVLDQYRIRNRYFHIVIDGTGLATSRIKYNENCLIKNKTDKNGNEYKEYSTYVLEGKLVVGDMVFSIGTEFVENKEDIEAMSEKGTEKAKQDCELKAFTRLAKKIKDSFPRLSIIISGDALYANKEVMKICKENKWKYIIRLKEGAIPTLYKDFEAASIIGNESKKTSYEMITKLEYQDYSVNVIRYKEKYKEQGNEKEREFTYITDLPVSDKNIVETITLGRKRWKIENEGFNIQKNGIFNIGHLYSKNQVAIKVHYILIQMAHMIIQLLKKGSIKVRELDLLLLEIPEKIKESLTTKLVNLEKHNRMQLRFSD